MSTNNGRRVAVSFGDFEGDAGFVQLDPRRYSLAYAPNKRGVGPGIGETHDIEGTTFKVVGRDRSRYASGLVVLSLRAADTAQ
jgi:hypothetical protein